MNLSHTKLDTCVQRVDSIRSRLDSFEEGDHPRGKGGKFAAAKSASESAGKATGSAVASRSQSGHDQAAKLHWQAMHANKSIKNKEAVNSHREAHGAHTAAAYHLGETSTAGNRKQIINHASSEALRHSKIASDSHNNK